MSAHDLESCIRIKSFDLAAGRLRATCGASELLKCPSPEKRGYRNVAQDQKQSRPHDWEMLWISFRHLGRHIRKDNLISKSNARQTYPQLILIMGVSGVFGALRYGECVLRQNRWIARLSGWNLSTFRRRPGPQAPNGSVWSAYYAEALSFGPDSLRFFA